MDAIETLRREHRTCREVVSAARRRVVEADNPDPADAGDFIDFFRYFATSQHGPKENGLFAALHRCGLPWEARPLPDLLAQHEAMRITLQAATDWLLLTKAGRRAALGPLVHDLRVYLDELMRHLQTEEQCLFPLATARLASADRQGFEGLLTAAERAESQSQADRFYDGLARRLMAA